MAEEEPIAPILQNLLNPLFLDSFREGFIPIELQIHRPTGDQKVVLDTLFPFHTLLDLKVALYIKTGKEDVFAPDFVYMSRKPKDRPVDFMWELSGPLGGGYTSHPPFSLAKGEIPLDTRFVDSTGQRKLVGLSSLERMTIEDFLVKSKVSSPAVFHIYLYSDLAAAVQGPRPISEKEWNGRLYPFFPMLSVGSDSLTPERRERLVRLVELFERRQGFLTIIDSFLKENLPLIPMTFAGIRLLRLVWGKPKEKYAGIEALFYEAAVTKRRPYMRLIPTEGTPVSKVHMLDKTRPDIPYPKILETWLGERSPTPERDYAFAKILLRPVLANLPPIYGTLRLFDDGTADCIVEPPKPMKKLDIMTDLQNFSKTLTEGLDGFPGLQDTAPSLGNGIFLFGFKLQKEDPPFTSRSVRQRLPLFSGIFQEILPLPGEKPLAVLRYKQVSNFATEDRIFTFLSQVLARKLLRGDGVVSDLVELVSEEFQLDMVEARKKVAEKLSNQANVTPVSSEANEYILTNNPGTDIAIYGQHPFYTLHFYRVDSYQTLQRCLTALSILFSASQEELQIPPRLARDLRRVELQEAIQGEGAAPGAREGLLAEAVEPMRKQDVGVPQEEANASEEALPQEEANASEDSDLLPDYLDSFMMGDSGQEGEEEGKTLEETHVEEEQEKVTEKLKEAVKAQMTPKETLEDVPNLPVSVAAKQKPEAQEDSDSDSEDKSKPQTIANFFINKLKDADRRLFDYTKTHPSLKKYVSQCQVTHMRQPAVLSEAKFRAMEQEYGKEVVFVIYPIEKGQAASPPAGTEFYSVLRYGSSKGNQNYYLCSRYFCVRDEILVREADLKGTTLRRPVRGSDGKVVRTTKQPMTCPFCEGRLIGNRGIPGPNETILERIIKPTTKDKRHLYISFLKKTQHPDGFPLPCCFIDEHPIKVTDPLYEKYRSILDKETPDAQPKGSEGILTSVGKQRLEEEEEDDAAAAAAGQSSHGPRDEVGLPVYDYSTLLATANKRYIVGAEKFPLEVGIHTRGGYAEQQIGLLPAALDEYFDQDQTKLVSRAFNPQKIKPDGQGFLRVGVENRLRYKADSILAAVAPFYMKNSAAQMKDLLVGPQGGGGVITPRIFLAMNYGNLAIEFYDPTDRPAGLEEQVALKQKVRTWCEQELNIDMTMDNEESQMRAYLSWVRFEGAIRSTTYKKEFRHFALFFAQAGNHLRGQSKGITFIVLDILRSGKMQVRCQPYGFLEKGMGENDVGFLLHHWSGVWEPIFYIDNHNAEERHGTDMYTLLFRASNSVLWPPIVKQRIQEYKAQCISAGPSIYTSQSHMNPRALLPSGLARKALGKIPGVAYIGVVRDAYNHIAAILFQEEKKGAGLIPVPVVDDGSLMVESQLFLDWEDIYPLAPVQQIIDFYRKQMDPITQVYKGYRNPMLKLMKGTKRFFVQLENRIVLPAGPPPSDAAIQEELRIAADQEAKGETDSRKRVTIDEVEWAINHEIAFQEFYDSEEQKKGSMPSIYDTEFQEIYEHFRLTFSNWVAEEGGSMRDILEQVIFDRGLPLFERRKRMEILLQGTVLRWLTTDLQDRPKDSAVQHSLLRVDCRLRAQDACTGRCAVSKQTQTCAIHVPKEVDSMVGVSVPRILMLRLIDELILYGEKRRELLYQDVSRMPVLDQPVRIGNQMIYPEKSAAWYELLRFTWMKKMEETPLFLEEMAARGKIRPKKPLAPQTPETTLPVTLQTVLGAEDPKTGALRLLRAPLKTLLLLLGQTEASIGVQANTVELSEAMMKALVKQVQMRVIQISLFEDQPKILSYRPPRDIVQDIVVFVVDSQGFALLLLNPDAPAYLRPDAMPANLKQYMQKDKSISVMGKPKPVARAPVEVVIEESGPAQPLEEPQDRVESQQQSYQPSQPYEPVQSE